MLDTFGFGVDSLAVEAHFSVDCLVGLVLTWGFTSVDVISFDREISVDALDLKDVLGVALEVLSADVLVFARELSVDALDLKEVLSVALEVLSVGVLVFARELSPDDLDLTLVALSAGARELIDFLDVGIEAVTKPRLVLEPTVAWDGAPETSSDVDLREAFCWALTEAIAIEGNSM